MSFLNKYIPEFMSLKRLRPYFDLTSKQFIKRLGFAMVPFNKSFVMEYNRQPDLYGPFWVLTTLVCTLFISSNLYYYINFSQDKDEALGITFKQIPIAAAVIYGVGFGLPLLMKLVLNLYGTRQQPQNQS